MKSFATWQHWFDVDSNFLSYPAPKMQPVHLLVVVIVSNFIEIRSVFVQSEKNPDVGTEHRDNGTYSENITAKAEVCFFSLNRFILVFSH